jgi:16S rRNA (guanine527-N7)-methyltransferase
LNIERPGVGERSRLADTLSAAALALHLPISPRQSAELLDFVTLLHRWNATYNLTAIRDPPSMLTHHIVDCLAAVPPLRREIAARGARRLLDVGSGGGLPGVVFAVMEPDSDVTCVESVGKKAAFLKQAGASLELGNLHVEQARVETIAASPAYDVVVSRAFASLADFVRLTAGALGDSGVWMAMKGKLPEEEIEALPADIEVFHVEPLAVPGLGAARCLIWLRQRESVRQHPIAEAGRR